MRTVLVRERGWIDAPFKLVAEQCHYYRNTLVSIDPATRFVVITLGDFYNLSFDVMPSKLPHPMGYYSTLAFQARMSEEQRLYVADEKKIIVVPGQKHCINVREPSLLPVNINKVADDMHEEYVDALITHYDFILGKRK